MPTVTINIAGRGTPLANGSTSSAGHMWVELSNGGRTESFGFAPIGGGTPFAPGTVYENDSGNYKGPYEYRRTLEISESQYNAMRNFASNPERAGFDMGYNAINNSCVDYAWKTLERGGLNPSGFEGDILPTNNIDEVKDIGKEKPVPSPGGDPFTGMPWPGHTDPSGPSGGAGGNGGGTGAAGGTGKGGGSAGANATVLFRLDPLVLDLDGDGIETIGTRDSTRILFDHNGDGIRTATGWIRPDDGWLVLDRNNNAIVDSGRELFGVDTIKRDGRMAINGFDALQDLDANRDGFLNARDIAFSNLRIWRDLNQDGVSQANELTTLATNRIVSIGVRVEGVNKDLGNGNVQTATGIFTREGGADGEVGETNGASGNLELVVDSFYRSFMDHIPLSEQATLLPNLFGSGQVRDLKEAVSLSPELGRLVENYLTETGRAEQIHMLDTFIGKWAETSSMKPLQVQAASLVAEGVTLTYRLAGLVQGTKAYDDFIQKLGVVERFMGFTYAGANGQARFSNLDSHSGNLIVSLAKGQIHDIELAYERFKIDIYESLVVSTRLASYSRLLLESDGEVKFHELEESFSDAIALNPQVGLIDLIEFISAVGEHRLLKIGWAATGFLISKLQSHPHLSDFSEELSSWFVRIGAQGDDIRGAAQADLIVSSSGKENIKVGDGNDIVLALEGSDVVDGENGSDILFGGAGDDTLTGAVGDDRLFGGQGSDNLNGGIGNDTLCGDQGNDTLEGAAGDDTFQFSHGFGTDVLIQADGATNRFDTVLFKDLQCTDLTVVKRVGSDLVLQFADDRLTLKNYFYSDLWWEYKIDAIKFADGVSWNRATIAERALTVGTDGNDSITGYNAGPNRIDAGAGNDTVTGGSANDILHGGAGNDVFSGGKGNDTYLFARGFGADTIVQNDSAISRTDTVQFSDLNSTDLLAFERRASDLVLQFADDRLTLKNYFYSDSWWEYKVDAIKFADGVAWDRVRIAAQTTAIGTDGAGSIRGSSVGPNRMLTALDNDTINATDGNNIVDGGAGNDIIWGYAGNDTIDGGDGNDVLDGGIGHDTLDGSYGNDTLTGGTGNDSLNGGYGSDIFLFAQGFGSDVLVQDDYPSGRTDIVRFTDLNSDNLREFARQGSDLIIRIDGDDLNLKNYFYSEYSNSNRIDQIQFANGEAWNQAAIKNHVESFQPWVVEVTAEPLAVTVVGSTLLEGSGTGI